MTGVLLFSFYSVLVFKFKRSYVSFSFTFFDLGSVSNDLFTNFYVNQSPTFFTFYLYIHTYFVQQFQDNLGTDIFFSSVLYISNILFI